MYKKIFHIKGKDKICFACLFLLSASILSGCDFIYKFLDKEGAEEKDLVGEIIPFEENPTIKEVQELLYIYGYSIGKPDGILGGRTRKALEKFQEDNNLKPTKFVDTQTWKKLRELRDYKLVDGIQVDIKVVQYVLKGLDYNIIKIDGKLGPKTIKAIKAFQKDEGLKVDGKIGYKTLQKLSQHIEIQE